MAWVTRSASNTWRVRYRRDDNTIATINGFPDWKSADEYAQGMKTDQRRGTFVDPDGGRTLLGEWVEVWLGALDVAQATEDYYRSLLTNHILPRWGTTAVGDVSSIAVATWARQLRTTYAESTVSGIVKLLTLLMVDAAEEKLIAANPIRARRRGRRLRTRPAERVWATPEQVLAVADGVAQLPAAGAWDALLVVTAAWTGARWGELTGLNPARVNLHPDLTRPNPTGPGPGAGMVGGVSWFVVDPHTGSLHEDSRGLWLGPPKTAESAGRRIELPPFLARLLAAHLRDHTVQIVFPAPGGGWHRRSNFARRALHPATRGTTHRARPAVVLPAVRPGLSFHGLRHSHKTWMIADGVPEVGQAERLGHILGDKVTQTYSHVADEVRRHLLAALQDRWDKAVAERGTIPAWRAAAGDPGSH